MCCSISDNLIMDKMHLKLFYNFTHNHAGTAIPGFRRVCWMLYSTNISKLKPNVKIQSSQINDGIRTTGDLPLKEIVCCNSGNVEH